MGDLQVCSVPRENGVGAREDRLCGSTTSSFESSPSPDTSLIPKENWEAAERRTNDILCRIRPTVVADKKRREVVKYVRDLINGSLGCKVLPYGSVPLKTYLPDGDVDLTAISTPNFEDTLVADVHAVLKREEHNKSTPYKVKDVHIIDAEVKLVKCLVQNIVVDISFNQLGGLCTLCFLELVDGIIGNNHLFKRSIILIKAWCYYESRILGAHHGLISTYALETLVLYIFHVFHSSLDGPLAVLHQFLDYFSKFDWENCCVSLNGPVYKSSLPDGVVKGQENGREGPLLSEEFLQEFFDKFSVPSRGMETDSRAFPRKHLNIIDVLKENNNLGRSVNRGNSYRIRSAFKYGARKLGQILMLPNERLAEELNKFLANTLLSHGGEYLTDVRHFAPAAGALSANCSVSSQHSKTFHEDGGSFRLSGVGYPNDKNSGFKNNQKGHVLILVPSPAVPELNCTSDKIAVLRSQHFGDAKDVAPRILSSRNRDDSFSCLPLRTDFCISLPRKSQQAPHGNRKIENRSLFGKIKPRSVSGHNMNFALRPESKNSLPTNSSILLSNNHENIAPNILALSTAGPNNLENSFSTVGDTNLASSGEKYEHLKSLLDLGGHYENYLSNLIYARNYHFSAPGLLSPNSRHQLKDNNLCGIWQSVQLEPKVYYKMNASSGLGPCFYPVNPLVPSNADFTLEDRKRSQGTGTYFPKVNYCSTGDRPLSGKGRFQSPGAHGQSSTHKNGFVTASTEKDLVITSTETKFSEEGSCELSQEEFPVLGNGKSAYSDAFRPQSSVWGTSKANGYSHESKGCEPWSCGVQLGEVPLPEVTAELDSDMSPCLDSASVLEIPAAQSPNSVTESNPGREVEFHLKNEVEFPPLSL